MPAELGRVIREIRQRRNMSQGDLGRFAGVDRSIVSRWERNQRRPNLGTLRHLAVMLRLRPEEKLALAVAALGIAEMGPALAAAGARSDGPACYATDCGSGRLVVTVDHEAGACLALHARGDRWSGEVAMTVSADELWSAAVAVVLAATAAGTATAG